MIAFILAQALAEYVGAVLKGVPESLNAGARIITGFVSDHPVFALGALLVVLVIWAVFTGSGRRG